MMGDSRAVRPEVIRALGPQLSSDLVRAIRDMEALDVDLPAGSGFHMMRELELEARTRTAAIGELVQRLGPGPAGRSWSYWPASRDDGTHVAWATTIYDAGPLTRPEDAARFMLLDVHSRLAGWYLSHSWRASDLFVAAIDEMNEGRLLAAAAASRALLEGVASFVVEGNQLLDEWQIFKAGGVPDHTELLNFRARFNRSLAQPQFGTRLGERSGKREQLRRLNVMTLLEKFLKRYVKDDDAWDTYEWLCDAVHPSFGSHAAYWRSAGPGPATAWYGWTIERRFGSEEPPPDARVNEVAQATVSAMVLSVSHLAEQSPRLRWFVHDFGLTTGAAAATIMDYWGTTTQQSAGDPCLCASGLSATACPHGWGSDREPPVR